ncbi:MAG: SusC/RagA family TonB-linked outer membrane protein, partial [Bacteroidota bacterium]
DANVTIGAANNYDVVMQPDAQQLEDVVVTALGISREERSLGYSVQGVSNDDIAVKDPVSATNSLQGRVSGVQIKSGAGTVGGSSSVVIRGASSLGGSNQPLYVVDGVPISNYDVSDNTSGYDYGNGAQDINPDDIESMSVLKGAAATTLYGSRGANGVIIINTKSGKGKKGIGVEVNSTTTFDQAYIFPEFQNEYGGGRSLDFDTFDYADAATRGLGSEWAAFDGTPVVNTGSDESWGPKMDGQEVLHWDSFVPESKNYLKTRPFEANPDNYKNIFNTGETYSNSVSIQNSGDDFSYRLSYTNVKQKGIVPGTELKKNVVSLKASTDLTNYLEFFTNVNYITQKTRRARFGYSGNGSSIPGGMRIWTQRQLNTDFLRDNYYSPSMGQQVGWNMRDISNGRTYMRWSNNPFWILNNIYAEDAKNRVYGNIGFKVNLAEGLTLTSTARTDFYSLNTNDRRGSGGTAQEYYQESRYDGAESNFETVLNYTKRFKEDWSFNAMAGGNIMSSTYKSSYAGTVDGFIIDNFYSISNTVSPADTRSYFSEKQINSLFATASMGYKNLIYLDIAGRNDWSSTLPVDNNSYFYPSVSTSFVFSELIDASVLSFGKLRAGYAFVGNDTSPYKLYNTYLNSNYGETTTFEVADRRLNSKLRNELTKELELGLELSFLQDRVGAEFTYFDRRSTDLIFPLDVSNTTGYSDAMVNAGELQNTGIETVVFATPVKTSNFSWDISLSYSTYKSKVISLIDGLDEFKISDNGVYVTAKVGGEYGTMYTTSGYVYDEEGRKLVDEDGDYMQSGEPVKVGNIMPDFNGGLMNTFNYRGVIFSALVDFQKGGSVYSWGNKYAASAGQTPETVGINENGKNFRDPVSEGGGILSEGVFGPDTGREGEENDIYNTPRNHFRHARNFNEEYVYDASYVKLRELKLGYSIPQKWISNLKLENASISLVARNVALLMSNTQGFDPEQVNSISNSSQGYEGGSLPSTRSIGFNLNLKF